MELVERMCACGCGETFATDNPKRRFVNHSHGRSALRSDKLRRDTAGRAGAVGGTPSPGHGPGSPPPTDPLAEGTAKRSFPQAPPLDAMLSEARALLSLPHVLAVTLTRDGRVSTLRCGGDVQSTEQSIPTEQARSVLTGSYRDTDEPPSFTREPRDFTAGR